MMSVWPRFFNRCIGGKGIEYDQTSPSNETSASNRTRTDNLETITQHLQDDGVQKFAKDFSKLIDAISQKREQFERQYA
jgi:transaldolase